VGGLEREGSEKSLTGGRLKDPFFYAQGEGENRDGRRDQRSRQLLREGTAIQKNMQTNTGDGGDCAHTKGGHDSSEQL